MKFSLLLMALLSTSYLWGQSGEERLRIANEKMYGPRLKSLIDMVLEIESPQLVQQLNEQKIFGHLNNVSFKVYWTADPERIAIEVLGMPEGFREIKEELKLFVSNKIEYILPMSWDKKFAGYSSKQSSNYPNNLILDDTQNTKFIPQFELIFDKEQRIAEIIAKKPVGISSTRISWEKSVWSEPRFYIKSTATRSEEGPQKVTTDISIDWNVFNGIGLPTKVKSVTKQIILLSDNKSKPIERLVNEDVYFKNYLINTGEARKWFLSNP